MKRILDMQLWAVLVLPLWFTQAAIAEGTGQPRVFVNHVGFTPGGAKYFVVTDPPAKDFQI